jgi:hypothetical protein
LIVFLTIGMEYARANPQNRVVLRPRNADTRIDIGVAWMKEEIGARTVTAAGREIERNVVIADRM